MNAREGFRRLCNFQAGGKLLTDYLADHRTDAALRRFLGSENERDLLDYLNCDFFYLPGRDISQNEGALPFYKDSLPPMTETERVCPLGIRWRRAAYDSKFNVDEAIGGPFEDAMISEQAILRHPWPTARDFDFSPLVGDAEAHAGRVRIGGLWSGIMGDSYRMHGFQNFLYNMAVRPTLIHALVDRMTQMYLELNDRYFSALKGKMEIWFFGNDFGSQEGLLMRVGMWSEFFFEPICDLCALANAYDLKVMMHSCGAIAPLIPHLMEAGVDILDPIQVSAKGMSPERLGAEFGGKIIFHGGIDTQHVLPESAPDEVKEHVRAVVDALGNGNGYIGAPSQILGADIPIANILAMYEAMKEINGHERQVA